jgi:hypothetical protein
MKFPLNVGVCPTSYYYEMNMNYTRNIILNFGDLDFKYNQHIVGNPELCMRLIQEHPVEWVLNSDNRKW